MTQVQVRPVQLAELNAPKLGIIERQQLLLALNSSLAGIGAVTVAIAYTKQTEAPPRIADRDYVAMPGVSPESQFGQIVRVFRRKKDGAVRFTVASASRGDGATPTGYTCVIPEGIKSFAITGFVPVVQVAPEEGAT